MRIFLQVPDIYPSKDIEEGTNITILCVAMGTPIPTVSIFLNGILYSQAKATRLTMMIANISRDMDTIVCHAENGYGMGMQASKTFQVSCMCLSVL